MDADALLTFFDFPAEHWKHLRTSNFEDEVGPLGARLRDAVGVRQLGGYVCPRTSRSFLVRKQDVPDGSISVTINSGASESPGAPFVDALDLAAVAITQNQALPLAPQPIPTAIP